MKPGKFTDMQILKTTDLNNQNVKSNEKCFLKKSRGRLKPNKKVEMGPK